MRVVSWNCNSIRAREERAVAYLERARPDVVCLQETKVVDEDFPRGVFEALGYEVHCYGQKTYNGVAILSQHPADLVESGIPGFEDPQARVLRARVQGMVIYDIYAPNGREVGTEHYDYKLKWYAALREHLETAHDARSESVIVCGDYNIAPEDRDVYDPAYWKDRILFSQPEKDALQRLLDLGYTDLLRHHHPEEQCFTWWDYRQLGFPKNRGLRIDHFIASRPACAASTGVEVIRDERKGKKPSDHAPVMATFEA